MTILINIFLLFIKISAFSFGGGYVAFPIISEANQAYGWMTDIQLQNILSVAGMSPGPVAINAAVGVGYQVGGIPGVFAAFLGIAIPCGIIVILVATFFFKIYKHPIVRNILYILRSVITGVILYAGVSFALKSGIILPEVLEKSGAIISKGLYPKFMEINLIEVKSLILILISFLILLKTKVHPILIILSGGILGIFMF